MDFRRKAEKTWAATVIEVRILVSRLAAFRKHREMSSLMKECGSAAVALGARFDAPNVESCAEAARRMTVESGLNDNRIARLRTEISACKISSSRDRLASLTAELHGLCRRGRQMRRGLTESIRTCGRAILSHESIDPRFRGYGERKSAIDLASVRINGDLTALLRQRIELRQSLGLDVRTIYGAFAFILLLGSVLWMTWGPDGGTQPAFGTARRVNPATDARTIVFVIPGTFGNDSFWPNTVPGQATFGSELQRWSGAAEVYPFLWYGQTIIDPESKPPRI